MSAFRNLHVVLTANHTDLRAGLSRAAHEVDSFTRKVEHSNRSLLSTGMLMKAGLAAGATAAAAGLMYASAKAIEFERSMRNVNSLTKMGEADFQRLSKQVVAMSTELPQSANTLAKGLYEITSSGFAGAEGMEVLRRSAEAASAGLSTTEVAAKGIAATLNAYGLEASDAADVSDTLFQTVNLGVISFEELASNLGDVVGGAAAAKVSIDQVGSAIATMTLAGIGGAEATTSLNRLLQATIQPSEALSEILQSLGYESGATALETDGLQVVMEKLRVATGGNIESLLALFPEIRAARGALALMANEGQNYAKVAGQIEDKNARAGATAAALKEQMKAVANQLSLAKNQIEATAISVGTKLLPVILKTMEGAGDLAGTMKEGLGSLSDALGPTWQNLAEILTDVWDVLVELGQAVAPVAEAFAKLGAGAVVATLNALTEVLAGLTGVLADNQVLAMALAIALGIHLLGGVTALTTRIGVGLVVALSGLLSGLTSVTAGATAAKGAMLGLASSTALATAGISVLLAGAAVSWMKYSDGVDEATGSISKYQAALKAGKLQEQVAAAEALGAKYRELKKDVDELNDANPWERLTNFGDSVKTFGAASKLKEMGEVADDAERDVKTLRSTVLGYLRETSNLPPSGLADQFDTEKGRAEAFAKALPHLVEAGVEVGDSFGEIRNKLKLYSQAQQDALNGTPALARGMGEIGTPAAITAEKLEAAKAELEGLGKAMGTFADPLGVYNGLMDDKIEKEREAAEATADSTKNTKDSWRDFVRDVKVSLGEYAAELEKQNQAARDWETNLVKVAGRAGTDVAGYLADMGEDGVQLVAAFANGTDAEVRRAAAALRDQMKAGSNGAAADLKAGMAIMAANAKAGGKATASAISTELGIGLAEVERIAAAYGIKLASGINPLLAALGARTIALHSRAGSSDGRTRSGYADGGFHEEHEAQIARAGEWRVWAEPETGGEAYIPLSPAKRKRSVEIWQETGRRLGTFASGGFHGPEDVPGIPSMGRRKPPVSTSGNETNRTGREHVLAWLKDNVEPEGATGGFFPATGGKDLVAFGRMLQRRGARVSEHPAFGGVHAVHARNSRHYSGRAIDVNTRPGTSVQEQRELAPMAAAARAAGFGTIFMAPGHYNHLHVQMANGGILPSLHSGGDVSSAWRRSPGDGPDERSVRLQVGEQVISRSSRVAESSSRLVGGSGGGAVSVVSKADPAMLGALADLRAEVRALQGALRVELDGEQIARSTSRRVGRASYERGLS